jgi:hypothetical protein
MMGLALSGMGHEVTIGYYPYGRWSDDATQFDIRRQNIYANTVLKLAEKAIHFENMLRNNSSFAQLPDRVNMDV